MSKAPSAQAGFTLIEVLIVTLLLVFISVTTFRAMRDTIDAKQDVDFRTEINQEGRSVLAIMTRDIGLAYYFVAEDFIWQAPAKPKDAPEDYVTPPPTGPKPKPVTIFQGKENEILLSSKSHQRTYADSPEDEMHFVMYQLDGPRLIRAESFRAVNDRDREDKSKFRAFTVLENVKTFKLGYYDPNADKWVPEWDTEKPEFKDRLPAAVKLDIEYTPDYPEEMTRRKINLHTISSAIRISEAALKPPQKLGNSNSNATGNQQATPPAGGGFN